MANNLLVQITVEIQLSNFFFILFFFPLTAITVSSMHHMLTTHATAWSRALHELIMDYFLPVGPAWERERPQLQLITLPHRNTSEVPADTSVQLSPVKPQIKPPIPHSS